MNITIKSVRAADIDGNAIGPVVTDFPEPSEYNWGKADLSGQDAGRLMNFNMFKDKQGEARQLDLTWRNVGAIPASKAAKAFRHEYL